MLGQSVHMQKGNPLQEQEGKEKGRENLGSGGGGGIYSNRLVRERRRPEEARRNVRQLSQSTSPHHFLFFPHCIICSTQCLYYISLMLFWNDTVLLTLPWSTHKEHIPCPNTPRDWHFKGNPSFPCLWPIAATLHLWHKGYWSPTITPSTPDHLFLMHTHFYHAFSPWWSHPDSPWLTSSHMTYWVISSHMAHLDPI